MGSSWNESLLDSSGVMEGKTVVVREWDCVGCKKTPALQRSQEPSSLAPVMERPFSGQELRYKSLAAIQEALWLTAVQWSLA